jgi:hypothetical protein
VSVPTAVGSVTIWRLFGSFGSTFRNDVMSLLMSSRLRESSALSFGIVSSAMRFAVNGLFTDSRNAEVASRRMKVC